MKKLLIFIFVVALIGMAGVGCEDKPVDYSCRMSYCVKNETQSDIVVEVDKGFSYSEGLVNIQSGETAIVFGYRFYLSERGEVIDHYEGQSEIVILAPAPMMIINGDLMPDFVWKRKYWDFVGNTSFGIYTLTITDDLLENLLNNTEPTK